MKELDKYEVYKKKLNGVCEKNGLTYSIRNRAYPFLLTIEPVGGMDSQQSMIEGMEDCSNTGYISPDATLVFAYKDGVLTYKISETFTISDELFTKIKNLFKNLHFMWMQHFYRDWIEAQTKHCDADAEATAAEPVDGSETEPDAFDEFMTEGDSAPPCEDEDEQADEE